MVIIGGIIGASTNSRTTTEVLQEFIPAKAIVNFKVANGIQFLLYHGLGTVDIIVQMFHDGEQVLPNSMKAYGPDHIRVTLDVPMNGTLLILAL